MKKYFVAYMNILNPNYLEGNNITIDTEQIIVEKTLFGYQEIFTKYKFYLNHSILEENQRYNNKKLPWTINNPKVLEHLKKDKIVFLLDSDNLKLAKKRDIIDYIKEFSNKSLKKFYDKQKENEIETKNLKIEQKQETKEVKKLIKDYKKDLKNIHN